MPSSRGSSRPRDQTCVSYVSCFGRQVLYHFHYLGNPFKECSVQLLVRIRLPVTTWAAARQASLSITNSRSLLKFLSIASVMPSNHLILCHPLLLPSIFPSIRVFSSELVLRIRWPKYQSFSFSISPSNEYSELIFFRMDWLDLLAECTHFKECCFQFGKSHISLGVTREGMKVLHFENFFSALRNQRRKLMMQLQINLSLNKC